MLAAGSLGAALPILGFQPNAASAHKRGTTTTTTTPTTTPSTTTTTPTTTTTTTTPSSTPANSVTAFDTGVPYYATYQSHNTRMVYVPGVGIVLGYLHSWSGGQSASTDTGDVRVIFSSDNGASWTTLLDVSISGHSPPSMEVDSAGNVYAFVVNTWTATGAWMYKFPAGNYANYTRYTIGGGEANTGKFATAYDPYNNHLYYVRGDESGGPFALYTIDPSTGSVLQYLNMLTNDPANTTFPHYPNIYVANDGSGLTLLAWTNTLYSNGSSYYDIHYLVSPDHGQSWIGKNGAISSSSYPIDGTASGPSFSLMDPSEYNTSTYRWLSNVYAQDGKLFFVYSGNPGFWLRRVDWATRTGDLWLGGSNGVCGDTTCLNNLSALFSGAGTSGSRIFLTSAPTDDNIATLSSDDDGATWHLYATTPGETWGWPYALSGSHRLGPNGEILGAFTSQSTSTASFVHTVWNP